MQRNVLSVQFHTPVFVSGAQGVNLGLELDSTQTTSKYRKLDMRCDNVGVYVDVQLPSRPTPAEVFIPWPNVKNVRLAPEDKPPTSDGKLKAVA